MAEPEAPAAVLAEDGALRLTMPVGLAALPWAQARLAEFLRARGQPDRSIGRAELLLEELVTNVINHGHVSDPAAQVSLLAAVEPDDGCRLTFEDPGQPFDPASARPAGRPTRLEEARIGGLGLVLLQRMAQDFDYARLPDGRNRLSFRISPA